MRGRYEQVRDLRQAAGPKISAVLLEALRRRRADVDLNRWLSGGYAIPAAEEDDPGEDEMPPPER